MAFVSETAAPSTLSEDAPRRNGPLRWVLACVIASAVLLWLGTGLAPVPWLTWLAPLPVVAMSSHVRARTAASAAFVAWLAGSLNMWTYFHSDLQMPATVVAAFLVTQALVFVGVVTLFRALVVRGRILTAVLCAPAAWSGTEYLLSLVSPGGTFASLAYTQAEVLPVVQLTAVTGIWGISFLLMAAPILMAALLAPGTARQGGPRLRVAAVAVSLAALTLGYGTWHLWTPDAGQPLTIGLIDVRQSEDSLPVASPEARRVLDIYLRELPALAAAGAQIAVLPEKVLKASPADLVELERQLTRAAADNQMTIVVGVTVKDTASVRNAALAYAAGSVVRYEKQHLVSGWEDHMTPGATLTLLPATTAGLAICKDMDHPQLVRSYHGHGADLLLVPALDVDRDGWLHSRIAVVRGIENGVVVARAAGHGRLTASDASGRILTDIATGGTDVTAATVTVRPDRGATLYSQLGDWFAWLCLALTAVAVSLRFGTRRKNRPAAHPESGTNLSQSAVG
ncbi:nitrilase-related carbon-nitrogen hydrolase [Actinoplanes sp. NEAU-A12]|uniref:Nitrilase-related carbon-nitrogen hydrolase n=1 Tax=Actinoplanes sandaracinus TaxID=3045177 RepID=A0ABT6WSY0_9ACTN|nr:nitrilase-related carbon-nitrogen hydrolase [Actinoplanes sandaracinus]MDI6102799.1 nitrilase-related carbon-nitrogen hydrolase [Actinoplanes sandaracinus]